MALRHRFVSLCLKLGFSAAKKSNLADVKGLASRLHPQTTDVPLIRLGADGDGGYVVPDDLEGIAACFSPGVDDRASFEMALIERGIPCFLADASVSKAPIEHEKVLFLSKFLGARNDDTMLTLDRWVNDYAPDTGDLVLQIDIEGWEWIVLLNCSDETLRRFRIIVMEAHDLERLMDKHAFNLIDGVFTRLLEHFILVHNHPNNYGSSVRAGDLLIPRVFEMSWLRKDRAAATGYVTRFPHPLDVINDPASADVPLTRDWQGGPLPAR